MFVVIPGEVKSYTAGFMQKFGPNNIADYAELELSLANFGVLERSNLGPLVNAVALAYNLGDPNKARQTLQSGKLKTTNLSKIAALACRWRPAARRTSARKAAWMRAQVPSSRHRRK